MAEESGIAGLARTVTESGLVPPVSRGLVMLSGGPDSVALLFSLARVCGPERLVALHVNYGLRDDSDLDEDLCRRTCRDLGVELVAIRAGDPEGNLHDWARGVRYGEAESIAADRELDWVAVAHTRTDLAETVLYRLASSPGTRALRAMPLRRGKLVRPLRGVGREEVRQALGSEGIPFVEDPSNLDPSFARARIRTEVSPVLSGINRAAERNIARTVEELEQEGAFLEARAADLIRESGGAASIGVADLLRADPAIARHALRLLASVCGGRPVAVSIAETAEVVRMARRPQGGSLDLGGGVGLEVGSGVVIATRPVGSPDRAEPVPLPVPGRVRWEGWEFEAAAPGRGIEGRKPAAVLDPATLDRGELLVREWRPGDRIRAVGIDGRKRVVELMAERGLPRVGRSAWPVVIAGDEIALVPGIAVSGRFMAAEVLPEEAVAVFAEPPPEAFGPVRGPGA